MGTMPVEVPRIVILIDTVFARSTQRAVVNEVPAYNVINLAVAVVIKSVTRFLVRIHPKKGKTSLGIFKCPQAPTE